jgi:hypothetical protein
LPLLQWSRRTPPYKPPRLPTELPRTAIYYWISWNFRVLEQSETDRIMADRMLRYLLAAFKTHVR